MFTGLIENRGEVVAWSLQGKKGVLRLRLHQPFGELKIGESVAVNGCCLTVIENQKNEIAFDVSDETLRKTNLEFLQVGESVNLERALCPTDRLGGHFVLGHVDAVGVIQKRSEEEGSTVFEIGYPPSFANLLIEKGSVTVDGISLTVCDLNRESFCVYIIPHTLQNTILGSYAVGRKVNLEFDVLGKYVLQQRVH